MLNDLLETLPHEREVTLLIRRFSAQLPPVQINLLNIGVAQLEMLMRLGLHSTAVLLAARVPGRTVSWKRVKSVLRWAMEDRQFGQRIVDEFRPKSFLWSLAALSDC